jgi:hypothetical protein
MHRNWTRWIHLAAAGLVLFAVGCSGQADSKSQSKNTPATGTATLSVGATAPGAVTLNPAAPAGPSPAFSAMAVQISATPDVQLTDFAVAVKEIKFKREDQSATAPELEIEFAGPYFFDLLDTTGLAVAQQLGSVTVPAGTYDGIVFKLHKAAAADNPPAPLVDHTVYVAGTLNTTTSFTIDHDLSEEVTITGPNGIVIDTGVNNLVVNLDLMAVFTTVIGGTTVLDDLAAFATANPAVNPITVSPQSSDSALQALADKFKEAVKIAADFGEDANGDGQLEAGEDVE